MAKKPKKKIFQNEYIKVHFSFLLIFFFFSLFLSQSILFLLPNINTILFFFPSVIYTVLPIPFFFFFLHSILHIIAAMSSKMLSFLFGRNNATPGAIKSVSKLHTASVSNSSSPVPSNISAAMAPQIKARIKYAHHETNQSKPWVLKWQQRQKSVTPATESENKMLFKFKSCNDAVTFAVGQGWDYTVEQTANQASCL